MEIFKNFTNKFYEQNLPGFYKKKLTLKMCALFFILGITNIALGVVSIITFRAVFTETIPYRNESQFLIDLELSKKIKGPVFLYLQVSNFYQSFFRYARGFSADQLKGEATTSIYDCYPIRYKDDKIIYPCGLVANSFVFDTYKMQFGENDIEISEKNIAWKSAIDRIQPSRYPDGTVVSPPLWPEYENTPNLNGNERLANWMLPASFPTFRKLYGRIDQNLEPGMYKIIINNISEFGEKSLVITNSSWLGDKNYFLSVTLITSGVVLMLSTVFLWCLRDKYGY